TPGIFIVLSGFATTDLSVRFCDACQGGEAYRKTAVLSPYHPYYFSSSCVCSRYARRSRTTERSELVSEEAE
ncbi:hypothetical protein, partial [Klebsiella grimontii]|uniref:hypothetical protein n=1 Tax=Klebsiella grimontii TaxID=2058152 RepID=UPI001CC92CE7